MLKSADIAVKPIDVDPAMLAKLKIDQPYRARVESHIVVDEGADKITVTADVHGSQRRRDQAADRDPHRDDARRQRRDGRRRHHVREFDARADRRESPITLDTLTARAAAKLTARSRYPTRTPQDMVAVIGRGDITGGTVGGTIAIGGTIGMPTVDVDLTRATSRFARASPAANRRSCRSSRSKATGTVRSCRCDINGSEAKERLIDDQGDGKPRVRKTLVASLTAVNFDLAPVTAFGPARSRRRKARSSGART